MSSKRNKRTPVPVGSRQYKPVKSIDKNGNPIVRYHRVDDDQFSSYHERPTVDESNIQENTLGTIDKKFPDMDDDLRSYIKSCPNIYHSIVDINVHDDHLDIRYEGNNSLVIGRSEEEDHYVATLYHNNKEIHTNEGNSRTMQRIIDRAGDAFDEQRSRISINENAFNNLAKGGLLGAAYKASKGNDAGEEDRRGPIFNFLNKWFRWFPGNG